MSTTHVRIRFAPSPTGLMHLGNVRAALLNYLFAKQKNGTFVLRIEDTDPERNFDPGAKQIISDLHWLGLTYQEGPEVGGPFAPYFQSERVAIYKKALDELIEKKQVYRCFCTTQELEEKRKRQIALRRAPRYDGTCLNRSEEDVQKLLEQNKPFIWRMKLDHDKAITIQDIAHGDIKFEFKNFSDFPLTRQNGTYTFMFANFVDDMVMEITHVLRGEDHLTNTAGQAALYEEFEKKLPIFWHLPILCNIDGKKLSKRDFGFSLKDLKKAGYLPEAICNYLAILGASFEQEIMSLDELVKVMNLDESHAKGQIKYDVEKLNWINHKWIARYDIKKLAQLCRPYLEDAFPEAKNIKPEILEKLVHGVQTDLVTLNNVTTALQFYFEPPNVTAEIAMTSLDKDEAKQTSQIIAQHLDELSDPEQFLTNVKADAKKNGISLKTVFSFVRLALTGATKGPGVKDLIEMLGTEETKNRLNQLIGVTN